MRRLIEEDPDNQEVIFPYIGGDEVNSSPTHANHRYVINFGEKLENECRERWPKLMDIVEAKVKPGRQSQGSIVNPKRWWMFARPASNLSMAASHCERVLVCPIVSNRTYFIFLPAGMVFSHKLVVFPFQSFAASCVLQSNVHGIWSKFFSSTMKDDINYSPSDCFETFPFPNEWDIHPAFEAAGQTYYQFRAELMVRRDEGLTKTYNRFHDPNETDSHIQKLRQLHAAMDRVVLDAYGWTDIPTDCECVLDYEIDEETWGKKKKPYRYRWPDEVHDEVLARLLNLNQRRYAEEVAAGLHAEKGTREAAPKKKTGRQAALPSSNVALPLD